MGDVRQPALEGLEDGEVVQPSGTDKPPVLDAEKDGSVTSPAGADLTPDHEDRPSSARGEVETPNSEVRGVETDAAAALVADARDIDPVSPAARETADASAPENAPPAARTSVPRTDSRATPLGERARARNPARGATGQAAGGMTQGDELEVRLARMAFWSGSYARRGISLQRHFLPEPLLVTDLDLLAFDVSSRYELVKRIGEAKSGSGKQAPKPLDRAIWLAGLMRLVNAERADLVTAVKPSQRVRETALSLGVRAVSVDDIARWEARSLPVQLADVGAHGPSAFRAADGTRVTAKEEPELERLFWFLRSEVWFLDSWQAFKRLLGALRTLKKWWAPELDGAHGAALRWLYAETLSILSLHLVALVGRAEATASESIPGLFHDKLAEGAIPAHQMRALAQSFDTYLARVLRAAGANSVVEVESAGAFQPRPPDWTDPLIDLVARLSDSHALALLPRYLDLVVHERLVRRRDVSPEAIARIGLPAGDNLARERRQLAAFLRSTVELPEQVERALIS